MVYQIRIKGELGPQWADRFEGLTVSLDNDGDTLLTGTVVDQSALFGVLRGVRDLGLSLLSVTRIPPVLDESTAAQDSSAIPTLVDRS